MRSKFTGSAKPGNPAVDRCGAAGSEQRTPDPRAMAGLRSQALRPAARSWLTGVAGPRSRKRGPRIAERRRGAPEGAFLRFATEERDARKTSHRACFADRPPGASQAPAPAGAPLPSWEPRIAIRNEGLPGADTKNTGDDARPLVIPVRARPCHSGARAESAFTRVFEEHA